MRAPGFATWTMALALAAAASAQSNSQEFDVVVYEATPGGIAAAITAARLGHSVALIEQESHIGGMTTSGLGKSDIETKGAIGGLFQEFVGRVYQYYVKTYGPNHENVKLCHEGYYYEPSVAEKILNEMVRAEPRIKLWKRWRLAEAVRTGNVLTAIRVRNRETGEIAEFRAPVFIDGTYEGDLAAYAGAAYRIGREARSETHELDAGVVYMDYETRAFLPGTTGEGDKRIPAYTYRLCLTDDPANSYVLKSPPPDYDRKIYLGYIDDWKAGRMGQVVRALSIAALPNHKYDVNINPRPLGFPFAGENYGYPEGDWTERDKVITRLRNMTLGLLYFLQNDPAIPLAQRQLAQRYQLPKDEFTDNNHFPWQLYVREARRLVGIKTLSEQDVLVGPALGRTRIHQDSIAAGEYPIDSFPVRKREPGHDVALEGYVLMLDKLTHPYQIPYGVMVPRSVDGLLVPVAASTTHIAFATIRLEPTWMALGQAAGTAAHIALRKNVALRAVDIDRLQRELLRQGQVLTYFKDIDHKDPAYAALQYFGTKGFFQDYFARASDPVSRPVADQWLRLAFQDHEGNAPKLSGSGEVTAGDLKSALEAAGLAHPDAGTYSGPLTRGQFCRFLYDALRPN